MTKGKTVIKIIPIMMRDGNHESIKVGNAQYNDKREKISVRLELDASVIGAHYLLGKAIEMDLVEALKIEPIASDFGIQAADSLEESEDVEA